MVLRPPGPDPMATASPSVELSVSSQITSLVSRSSSFDPFACEVGAHVVDQRATIPRLLARVERLQVNNANVSESNGPDLD